jgi:hypothetical protein
LLKNCREARIKRIERKFHALEKNFQKKEVLESDLKGQDGKFFGYWNMVNAYTLLALGLENEFSIACHFAV